MLGDTVMTKPVTVSSLRLHCRGQDQGHNLPVLLSRKKKKKLRVVAGPSVCGVLAFLQRKDTNNKLELSQVKRFHVTEPDRPEVSSWLSWEIMHTECVARVRDKGVWLPSPCSQFFPASLHPAGRGGGVFHAHHEEKGARWPPPYSSLPFMKRP